MKDSIRFIKICPNDFSNASRDYRELEICLELGMDVIVLAKGENSRRRAIEIVNRFVVHRYTTRPLGTRIPNMVNRIVSVFLLVAYVRNMKPDIISGHDIICLTIGWMSNWFRKDKASLIYDSHEYELGRNKRRSTIQLYIIKKWEKFMINRSQLMIVVNDSIADEVKKIYRLKNRPLVIRNIAHKWNVDNRLCNEIRKEIIGAEDVERKKKLFLYCGVICEGRGIERAIKILTYDDNYMLLILGNAASRTYLKKLIDSANELGVKSRLRHHEAVPYNQMWKYIGACDVGLFLGAGSARSYYLSLPNKIFEYIQANVPILASDLPEIARIINKYEVGLTCKPNEEATIKEALDKMFIEDKWNIFKKNTFIAKEELCWEIEKKGLMDAYRKLMDAKGIY